MLRATTLTLALCLSVTPALAQENAADVYFDPDEMAEVRHELKHHNGDQTVWMVMGERLEYQAGDNEDVIVFDGQGWIGGDVNRFWVKAETEFLPDEDAYEGAEIQALYSRAVSPFWDLQGGIRQDLEPDSETYVVLGVQGLAPYRFEVDAASFLSTQGDLTASIEAEYELLFTQRLILQPRAELLLSAQDVEEQGIGAGLSKAELGLRLRYEIRREFAPYVGVAWSSSFGQTADYAEAEGESTDNTSLVAGVRFWF